MLGLKNVRVVPRMRQEQNMLLGGGAESSSASQKIPRAVTVSKLKLNCILLKIENFRGFYCSEGKQNAKGKELQKV